MDKKNHKNRISDTDKIALEIKKGLILKPSGTESYLDRTMDSAFKKIQADNNINVSDLPKKRILNKMLRERYLSKMAEEAGLDLPPDEFGYKAMFLEQMVNEDMDSDLTDIMREFMTNVPMPEDCSDTVEYISAQAELYHPPLILARNIFNLMMNAYSRGDIYTKELFKYIYKKYHKAEYNQLKRFSLLTAEDIITLSDLNPGNNDDEMSDPGIMARLLFMSEVLGIETEKPETDSIIELLNHFNIYNRQSLEWSYYDKKIIDRYEKNLFKICGFERDSDEITSDFSFYDSDILDLTFDSREEYHLHYKSAYDFVKRFLSINGFAKEYIERCSDIADLEELHAYHAIAILETFHEKDKKLDILKEEIPTFAVLYYVLDAFINTVKGLEQHLGETLGTRYSLSYVDEEPDDLDGAKDLSKLKELRKYAKKQDVQPGTKHEKEKNIKSTKKEPVPEYDVFAMKEEIESLRRKMHQQETQIRSLIDENHSLKMAANENSRLSDQILSQQKELSALREHVYRMTETEEEQSQRPTDNLKKELADLKIIIIGGHINWQNKLGAQFPKWTFISPEPSGVTDTAMFNNADYIYIFSDHISHAAYYKYINAIKERRLPFGYIHSINIESNIRQIYSELKDKNII